MPWDRRWITYGMGWPPHSWHVWAPTLAHNVQLTILLCAVKAEVLFSWMEVAIFSSRFGIVRVVKRYHKLYRLCFVWQTRLLQKSVGGWERLGGDSCAHNALLNLKVYTLARTSLLQFLKIAPHNHLQAQIGCYVNLRLALWLWKRIKCPNTLMELLPLDR
jgi:hypothetical protein